MDPRIETFLQKVERPLKFRTLEEREECLQHIRSNLDGRIQAYLVQNVPEEQAIAAALRDTIAANSPYKIGQFFLRTFPVPSYRVGLLDIPVYLVSLSGICFFTIFYDLMFSSAVTLAITKVAALLAVWVCPLLVGWYFGQQPLRYAVLDEWLTQWDVRLFALIQIAVSSVMFCAMRAPMVQASHGQLYFVPAIYFLTSSSNWLFGAALAVVLTAAAMSASTLWADRQMLSQEKA